MKRTIRRIGYLLLAVCLLLACVPTLAGALPIFNGGGNVLRTQTLHIPAAMDADQQIRTVAVWDTHVDAEPFQQEAYLTDVNAAGAVLREAMKNRLQTVTVCYETDAAKSLEQIVQELLAAAEAHTGVPTEGDYIKYQRGEIGVSASYYTGGTTNQYTLEFTPTYYTSAYQEERLSEWLSYFVEECNVSDLPDWSKLCTVYDWMCDNITYDYEHLEDDSYTLKYSAYAAYGERNAVCQGYAVLLYRLMLEMGVDCRVITGDAGGPHAWNIVELDGQYYNLDATWDAARCQGGLEYSYFLCTEAEFADHTRNGEFATEEFCAQYPMSKTAYVPTAPSIVASGTCHYDIVWRLTSDGVLRLSGEGDMRDQWDGVTYRAPWYDYRDRIRKVVIDEGITHIGKYAFDECWALHEVSLPNSLVSIGEYAFYDCCGLGTLTLPEGLTTIESNAFLACQGLWRVINLSQLELTPGVRDQSDVATYADVVIDKEGNQTYRDKLQLTEDGFLYEQDGEDYILRAYVGDLDTVTLPADINGKSYTIQDFRCAGHVIVPDFMTVIEGFSHCTEMTGITLPEGATVIAQHAFTNCVSLESIRIPDGVTEIETWTFNGCWALRSVWMPDSVTRIGGYVFENCASLTDVRLPNGIYAIERSMFKGCYSLQTITIPDGVTAICSQAFQGCSSLQDITLPAGVIGIGYRAFEGCASLTKLDIPQGVTSIGYGAFSGCSGLASLVIPSGVTEIEDDTFAGCSGLISLDLPSAITYIGNYAFEGCSSLVHISALPNVTYIGRHAFYNCSKLADFVIAESVSQIGEYAFYGCASLTNLVVPEGVIWIGMETFAGCSGLYSLIIPDSVTYIDRGAFENCSSLTSLKLPEGITQIEIFTFLGCSNLRSVYIPAGVRVIGSSAFSGCSRLESVEIPFGVTEIESYTFSGCSSLTSLVIPQSVTAIGDAAFAGCSSLRELVIPSSVTRIGKEVLYGCDRLESLSVPYVGESMSNQKILAYFFAEDRYDVQLSNENVPQSLKKLVLQNGDTVIEGDTFRDCSWLECIELPDTVTKIEAYAFSGCGNLTTLTIPESVTELGEYAFANCASLTAVRIPGAITQLPAGLFQNCGKLERVQIPSGVTAIGASAFEGCASLDDLVIPAGVTCISDSVFSGCTSLSELVIPSGVTGIGEYAFSGCTGLTGMEIPSGITSIPNYAFNGCENLISIALPASVTSIGECAFYGCASMANIVLPDGVTSVGRAAFYGCESLVGIEIPSGVTVIESSTFYGCHALHTVVMPEGVESIGSYAFYQCESLNKFYIPDAVTSIGYEAFAYCDRLEYLTLGSSVTRISDSAFNGNDALWYVVNHSDLELEFGYYTNGSVAQNAYVIVDKNGNKTYRDDTWHETEDGFLYVYSYGTCMLKAYLGDEETVTLPDSVDGNAYEIQEFRGAKRVIIPDGVTKISDDAFSGCVSLRSITIPDSVTNIGRSAFSGCTGLAGIKIPAGVISIQSYAFDGCESLTSIKIPAGVTSIGDYAFRGCSGLTAIEIPAGVTSIGDYAFSGCTGLTAIELPAGISSISSGIFSGCTDLTHIEIPAGVTSVGDSAFSGCSGLAAIKLPAGVTSIGVHAFSGCTGLTGIEIPAGVTSIGEFAFLGCTGLTAIEIPAGISSISRGTFSGCSGLTAIEIPAGVTSIGERAFEGCTGLTAIEIPAAVTSIGNYAFEGCNGLTMVELPAGVTSLGHSVFQNCEGLLAVVIPDSYTSFNWSIFSGCDLWHVFYTGTQQQWDSYNIWLRNVTLHCNYTGDAVIDLENKECSICTQELQAKCQHRMQKLVLVAPTCTDDGFVRYYCADCGVEYEETVDAFGHLWRKANCQAAKSCRRCQYAEGGLGGHVIVVDPAVAPTCIQTGLTEGQHCKLCGLVLVEQEVIDTVDHTYASYVVDPGCDSNGYTQHTCSVCGHSYQDTFVDPLGHAVEVWNLLRVAGCEQAGLEEGYCSRCYCYVTREIPARGHNYTETVYEPTCEYEGYTLYYCDRCATGYTENPVAPLGHIMGDWVLDYEPTCYSYGQEVSCCTREGCSHAQYRDLDPVDHRYDAVVTEPTCYSGGYTTYICVYCGGSYVADEVPALGHDMSGWVVITEATCTQSGYEENTCARCGYWESRTTDAYGHDYQSVVQEPTCTEAGFTTHTCANCGDSYVDGHTAAWGHSYTSSATNPTCTQDGYTTYTCTACGDCYTVTIPATGHPYTHVENQKDASCGDDGYTGDTVCDVCGQIVEYGTVLPATGAHRYDVWIVTDPTCQTDGEMRYVCQDCGHTYDETVPATGHQSTHIENQKDANCMEDGYSGDTVCDTCGKIVEYGVVIPSAGSHAYVFEVTVAPGCVTPGVKTLTCSICNHSYQEEIAPIGHNDTAVVTAPTCTEQGFTTHTCANCGESYVDSYTDALGHAMGDWVQIKAPTCVEEGMEQCACSRCGVSETRVVAMTDHSYTSAVTVAPGCETAGVMTYTCAACAHSYTEEIAATGHSEVTDPAIDPSCTESGWTEGKYCATCGKVMIAKEEIPPMGHNYTSAVTKPACTEAGYTTHTCANCGATYTSDHVEPLGHSWNEGVVTREPTVEAEGEKTYTCGACGATYTEVLPKKEPVIYDTPADDSVEIPENDCFEGGTTVTVEKVQEGELYEQVADAMENRATTYTVFAFTATKNNVAVQPNGKLKVTFDIPAGYSTNVSVYYLDGNGKLTKLDVQVAAQIRTVTMEVAYLGTFILADEDTAPAVLMGDVNGDGRINARDARTILRYLAGMEELSEAGLAAADFNGDGRVNARDARAILRAIAGLD